MCTFKSMGATRLNQLNEACTHIAGTNAPKLPPLYYFDNISCTKLVRCAHYSLLVLQTCTLHSARTLTSGACALLRIRVPQDSSAQLHRTKPALSNSARTNLIRSYNILCTNSNNFMLLTQPSGGGELLGNWVLQDSSASVINRTCSLQSKAKPNRSLHLHCLQAQSNGANFLCSKLQSLSYPC